MKKTVIFACAAVVVLAGCVNTSSIVNPVLVLVLSAMGAAVYGGYFFITKRRKS